jgi:hypothetical protein
VAALRRLRHHRLNQTGADRPPSFEVGAYEYFGRGLPLVGETILMRRTDGSLKGEAVQGYVTRVNPSSNAPIAVNEVPHST